MFFLIWAKIDNVPSLVVPDLHFFHCDVSYVGYLLSDGNIRGAILIYGTILYVSKGVIVVPYSEGFR